MQPSREKPGEGGRAIRLAIMAMGGEGGGVLATWLVSLAESNGHIAQMTSVPGVAQRTGATLYYVEMIDAGAAAGRAPVLAQLPFPGDVDIVLASELMEAGRAIQRGIVTPDRTLLITSTHRIFAIAEKIIGDDGRVDAPSLLTACKEAAKRLIALDMQLLAESHGSVISAVMFGALAASGALPFARSAFEAVIAAGGVGQAASQRAFEAAFEEAMTAANDIMEPAYLYQISPSEFSKAALPPGDIAAFPLEILPMIETGYMRACDFQDEAYGRLYLDRMAALTRKIPRAIPALEEAARYLALGMTYEDPIRVAELKIRPERFARIAQETGLADGQILQIRDYVHPRLEEVADTLPAPLGRFILRNRLARTLISRLTASGRVIETSSIRGFLLLYTIASLKRWRPTSLRHAREQAALEAWLAKIGEWGEKSPDIACEIARLRNLVKGYGDTHARGSANFARIVGLLPRLPEESAAAALAKLRQAALADETGARLAAAIGALVPTAIQA